MVHFRCRIPPSPFVLQHELVPLIGNFTVNPVLMISYSILMIIEQIPRVSLTLGWLTYVVGTTKEVVGTSDRGYNDPLIQPF